MVNPWRVAAAFDRLALAVSRIKPRKDAKRLRKLVARAWISSMKACLSFSITR